MIIKFPFSLLQSYIFHALSPYIADDTTRTPFTKTILNCTTCFSAYSFSLSYFWYRYKFIINSLGYTEYEYVYILSAAAPSRLAGSIKLQWRVSVFLTTKQNETNIKYLAYTVIQSHAYQLPLHIFSA